MLGLDSAIGVPVLNPEIVLLYKAQRPRPVDEQDFKQAHAALSAEQRRWLRSALMVCYSDHPWSSHLSAAQP